MTKKNRLLSLDVLRGITIAGMILVNNPGSWGAIYAPLRHAEWNGLTPTDLVFPFFMFIMGISAYFSLRKYDFKFTTESAWKVLRRSVAILLIGWAIAWLALFLRRVPRPEYSFWQGVNNFGDIRALGVFPRLAICYFFTAILALLVSHKHLVKVVVGMLAAYAAILLLGHGFEFSETNIISIVDHSVLGERRMYHDSVGGVTLAFDPEGLLSTLPSIAHCLIGFLCGGMIVAVKDNEKRAFNLFIIGSLLTMAGFLLSYGLPLNKKVWSPTFVLTTCGLASSLLALLIWVIDIRRHQRAAQDDAAGDEPKAPWWARFFEVFGINPLYLYLQATVMALLLDNIRVPFAAAADGFTVPHRWFYQIILVPLCQGNGTLASLTYALLFVLINWCVGLILYKKKIYIKI